MPRKQYKFHYIYKITCKINEKYYIGMHSTSNLEDGYFGSGKVLKRSLNKYGKENHEFEILEWLENRDLLKKREKEIVNYVLISDKLCMNIALGGGGGFSGEEHKRKWVLAGSAAGKIVLSKLWSDSNYRQEKINAQKKRMEDPIFKEKILVGFAKYRGTKHTFETKQKMKISQAEKHKGEKNSQYGTQWITNEKENKKIKNCDLIPDGWRKGRKIKKDNL